MDHPFSPCIALNSDLSNNNDPDQPINSLPIIPHKGLHSTHMPVGCTNHFVSAQPISTYSLVPGMQHGLTMQPEILFNGTVPFPNNQYHHIQQTSVPDTSLLYDQNVFHGENWMQLGFSFDGQNDGLNGGQNTSPQPTTGKKCEWKGCTYQGSFRRDAELIRHIKAIHVSRDAYKCSACGKGFGRKDKMEDHRRTHIGMERKISYRV